MSCGISDTNFCPTVSYTNYTALTDKKALDLGWSLGWKSTRFEWLIIDGTIISTSRSLFGNIVISLSDNAGCCNSVRSRISLEIFEPSER